MRGKRAKKLKTLATAYVVGVMKKSAGDGYNEYNQAMNRIDWEPQLDKDGIPLVVGGQIVLRPERKFPGTLTCAWHVRVMYQSLKRMWTRGSRKL